MTQEEKQLLIIDLCARLPYGVVCQFKTSTQYALYVNIFDDTLTNSNLFRLYEEDSLVRPYLRPMSSMTEEEHEEYKSLFELFGKIPVIKQNDKYFDFINSHYFDYRGLIEKGLALEAPENMYTL